MCETNLLYEIMNLSKYSIRGTIMRDGMTLVVDLRSGSIHTKKDEGEREYIGGGLGAYMLNKRIKGDVDAMGPENVLVITSGPFAGMPIPAASGIGIFSKSPLTGYFGDDYLFGAFGNQMSRAGYASIIIKGVSERPVYLYIDDGVCTIKRADELLGLSPWKTEEKIREAMNDRSLGVISIGQAGENKVRYATIYGDFQYSGCGLGAVMGSKRLKAIAIKGSNDLRPKDPTTILEMYKMLSKKMEESFVDDLDWAYDARDKLPANNFKGVSSDSDVKKLIGGLKERELKKVSFQHCPVACKTLCQSDGIISPITIGGISIGLLNGIYDPDTVIKAEHLCYTLGLDPRSVAVVAAFANELKEREDDIGFEMGFGKKEELLKFIEVISKGKSIFSEGIKAAAKKFGAEDSAMHSKGAELSIDTFTDENIAFGTAISHSGSYQGGKDYDTSNLLKMMMVYPKAYEAYSKEDLYRLYAAVGGETDRERLGEMKDKINDIKREFNIRQGWKMDDDTLPQRIMKNFSGEEAFLQKRLDYYRSMGWDEEGSKGERE